jgi:hypothetical protein
MILPFQSTIFQSPPVSALEQGGDKFNLGGGAYLLYLSVYDVQNNILRILG